MGVSLLLFGDHKELFGDHKELGFMEKSYVVVGYEVSLWKYNIEWFDKYYYFEGF